MRLSVIFLICLAAQAQDASPQFEVASIKPAPPPEGSFNVRMAGGPGTPDPGLFTCENFALSNLVTIAYSLNPDQLSGPHWMDDAKFNVFAKVREGTSRQQFNQMLQNLLVDRFHLKVHYEKKEVTQQVLTVAKNGVKFKPSPEVPDPSPPSASLTAEGDQEVMRATETSMVGLAAHLSGQLHQRVTDATGLPGNYDFTMRWAPDASAADGGSPLLEALQKQLGLKLESKKVMVDVLVIDHIEKTPTEN